MHKQSLSFNFLDFFIFFLIGRDICFCQHFGMLRQLSPHRVTFFMFNWYKSAKEISTMKTFNSLASRVVSNLKKKKNSRRLSISWDDDPRSPIRCRYVPKMLRCSFYRYSNYTVNSMVFIDLSFSLRQQLLNFIDGINKPNSSRE